MMIDSTKKAASFVRETIRGMVRYPKYFSLVRNTSYAGRWWSSLREGRTSMTDASPWICFWAADVIDAYLTKEMKVFEYGSGGSTMFLSSRCGEVISVEHHTEWYDRVNRHIADHAIANVRYFLIEPEEDPEFRKKDRARPGDYISDDEPSRGKHFERYVRKIEEYPDESFDLVIVDGRSRPSCCAAAIPKVKRGGMLLFDNVETAYYRTAVQLLETPEWEVRKVFGCVPYIRHFSMTLIARKKHSGTSNPLNTEKANP